MFFLFNELLKIFTFFSKHLCHVIVLEASETEVFDTMFIWLQLIQNFYQRNLEIIKIIYVLHLNPLK